MVKEERKLGTISAVQVVSSIDMPVINTPLLSSILRLQGGWGDRIYMGEGGGGGGGTGGPDHCVGGGTDTLAASNAFQVMMSSTHAGQASILNTTQTHKLWT